MAMVRALAGKRETELHVGDFPLATARLMPGLLRSYQKAMPNVQVKLHDWPVEKNIAGVREGRLQLAIIIPPLKSNSLDELRFESYCRARLSCCFIESSIRATEVGLVSGGGAGTLHWTHARRVSPLPGYLAAIFARVNDKPQIVEEHDGWAGVFSAVDAGTGVAIVSDAFTYAFGDRIKLLRLTPEPKRVPIGILTRRGRLSPAAEKFCECAREAFGTVR